MNSNNPTGNEPASEAPVRLEHVVRPTEPITYFQDSEIGMTMEAETIKQLPDGSWLASAKIGSIFGSEVDGELTGKGATKEEALKALKQERKELNDSLWA